MPQFTESTYRIYKQYLTSTTYHANDRSIRKSLPQYGRSSLVTVLMSLPVSLPDILGPQQHWPLPLDYGATVKAEIPVGTARTMPRLVLWGQWLLLGQRVHWFNLWLGLLFHV
jgi:hypothetical protein